MSEHKHPKHPKQPKPIDVSEFSEGELRAIKSGKIGSFTGMSIYEKQKPFIDRNWTNRAMRRRKQRGKG